MTYSLAGRWETSEGMTYGVCEVVGQRLQFDVIYILVDPLSTSKITSPLLSPMSTRETNTYVQAYLHPLVVPIASIWK